MHFESSCDCQLCRLAIEYNELMESFTDKQAEFISNLMDLAISLQMKLDCKTIHGEN